MAEKEPLPEQLQEYLVKEGWQVRVATSPKANNPNPNAGLALQARRDPETSRTFYAHPMSGLTMWSVPSPAEVSIDHNEPPPCMPTDGGNHRRR